MSSSSGVRLCERNPWYVLTPSSQFPRSSNVFALVIQATKAAAVRVCKQWHAIASPFLYEHVWISNLGQLNSILVTLNDSPGLRAQWESRVERLDVELFDAPVGSFDAPLSRLLSLATGLRTLVMGLDGVKAAASLLQSIPEGLKCLYWKRVEFTWRSTVSVDLANLCQFFEKQTSIETISFPFRIQTWPHPSLGGPYSSPRDWIVQEQSHIVSFELLQHRSLLPNVCSRSVSYQLPSGEIEMAILASGAPRESDPGTATSILHSLETNPTITRFNVVENLENPWPSHSLAHKLRIIRQQSPNVSQLDLTLLADAPEHFVASFYRSTYPIPRLPEVTTLSLQRVLAGSQLPDPVRTLHHLLKIPLWADAFPSLHTIRLLEDVDFESAKTCPTLAFVRERSWKVRIEDRFGELLIS